jgi:hypothetical protein
MGTNVLDWAAPAVDVSWVKAIEGAAAIVVDLPGADGIRYGMALAVAGYRPVPLYNACPEALNERSLVEVQPIMLGLTAAVMMLKDILLPGDAPPAFLLDSNRRTQRRAPEPGVLDNRSISLPTDYPSGNLLLSRGIGKVVLVQESATAPQADLSHTLRRWQEAGISVFAQSLNASDQARPITVSRPNGFRVLFYNLAATMGLKKSPLGGFGGVLPLPGGG